MTTDEPPDPQPIQASLDRVTRTLGATGADVLGRLFGRWPEIVGPQVAAHARPLSLARGALVVAVDEPGWVTQLTYLEANLLARLADALGPGAVARIEVRLRRG